MEKTTIHMVPEPRKSELVQATYGIVGAMIEVYKHLGAGMPEYIYQEALCTQWGPQRKPNAVFAMGRAGSSEYFLPKRNFGTCMRIDYAKCKALSALTEREHYQTFGYMRGTGWPVAILVNFGASPRAQIERFYNDNNTIAVF